jgi:hypothetical protein
VAETELPVRSPRSPGGLKAGPNNLSLQPVLADSGTRRGVKEALLYWEISATIVPLDVDTAGFTYPLYQDLAEAGAGQVVGISHDTRC